MTLQLIAQEWADDAACKAVDPEAFYPERNERRSVKKMTKAICGGCPVKQECLNDALSRNEPHGIWGGLEPQERARLTGRVDSRGRLRRGAA